MMHGLPNLKIFSYVGLLREIYNIVGSGFVSWNYNKKKTEFTNFGFLFEGVWGTRWRSWLRHCATSHKVAGSIPDGVIGIFH